MKTTSKIQTSSFNLYIKEWGGLFFLIDAQHPTLVGGVSYGVGLVGWIGDPTPEAGEATSPYFCLGLNMWPRFSQSNPLWPTILPRIHTCQWFPQWWQEWPVAVVSGQYPPNPSSWGVVLACFLWPPLPILSWYPAFLSLPCSLIIFQSTPLLLLSQYQFLSLARGSQSSMVHKVHITGEAHHRALQMLINGDFFSSFSPLCSPPVVL